MKEAVRKDLRRSDSPLALWDYCMERRAMIHNAIPRDLFQANGLSPYEITFGEQGDISNICNFDWFEWVYYKEPNSYPSNREILGRVLGPLKNEGNEMAQAVLTMRGTIVPRRTLRPLSKAETTSEVERRKRDVFTDTITKKLGNSMTKPPKPPPDYVPYEDGELDPIPLEDFDEDPIDSNGISTFEKPVIDHLIHAEVMLPKRREYPNG